MEELDNNIEEVQAESIDGSGPKGLRDENKRLKEELKEYKAAALSSTINSLGLNPVVAKAVTKLYDGKPDVESIKAYIKDEFGEIVEETTPAVEPNAGFTDASARVDKLSTSAVSDNPQSFNEQLAEVINNGSPRQSIAAKLYAMEQTKQQK